MAVSVCKKGIRRFPSPGGTETPQPLPTNLPSLLGRTGNGSRGFGKMLSHTCTRSPCLRPGDMSGLQEHTLLR